VSVGVVALVMGLVLIGLGQAQISEQIFSPGPLSSRHSSISQNCNACHAEAHGQPWQWFFSTSGKPISKGCQACHALGKSALSAHSLPVALLEELQHKIVKTSAIKNTGVNSAGLNRKLQCISCHKEHQGKAFRMVRLTNRQCQSCHSQSFTSFSKGHPQFTNYPFNKRVNILFDHTSHFSKHFAKKKATDITCKSCHAPDSSGGGMAIKSFDVSCAKCHTNQIYGKGAINKGIVFFGLPTLDVETLEDQGIGIGQWPADTDGEIPPMMRLMLSKDSEIAAILDEFSEADLELDDLSDEDMETLEKVGKVIWGIKKLLWHLISNGLGEFNDVIGRLDDSAIDSTQLSGLSGSLPVEILRAANKDWFGAALESELEKHAEGDNPPTLTDSDELEEIEDEAWMKAGGWYRSNGDFTIRYRPRGHGDMFIKSWVNLAAKTAVKSPVASELLENLTDRKNSPGMCMKCHSIEKVAVSSAEKSYRVHWQGRLEKSDKQSFNLFNHSSHLNLIKDKGCITCHSMNEDADFKLAYTGFDARKFESNFHPIKKSACIQCHQSGRVSESCTTCHKYHIGDFFTSGARMKEIRTELTASSPPVPLETSAPANAADRADISPEANQAEKTAQPMATVEAVAQTQPEETGAQPKGIEMQPEKTEVHETEPIAEVKLTVAVRIGNIRNAPDKSGKVLYRLSQGDVVTKLAEQNEWFQVRLNNGTVAWAHQSIFATLE